MNIILFALLSYAICFLLIDSNIFNPVRGYITTKSDFLKSLLSCYFCTGYWVGIFISIFLFSISGIILFENEIGIMYYAKSVFVDGFISASCSYLISLFVNKYLYE